MLAKEIQDGTTYLFVATDSVARQSLVGYPFTVQYRKAVFRKFKGQATRKRLRFFNYDGVGARAEELEPLPPELHHWDLLPQEALDAFATAFRSGQGLVGGDLPDLPF